MVVAHECRLWFDSPNNQERSVISTRGILIIALFLLLLPACGDSKESTVPTAPESSAAAEDAPEPASEPEQADVEAEAGDVPDDDVDDNVEYRQDRDDDILDDVDDNVEYRQGRREDIRDEVRDNVDDRRDFRRELLR